MKWLLIIIGLYLGWRWLSSAGAGSGTGATGIVGFNPFSSIPKLSDYELSDITTAADYQLRHGNNASQQNAAALLLALGVGSSPTSTAAEQGATQTELGNEALHARTDFNPNSLISAGTSFFSSFGF